jgi:hypothetical protein
MCGPRRRAVRHLALRRARRLLRRRDPQLRHDRPEVPARLSVSDANRQVAFITIYPGWYSGGEVHVHFKIRMPAEGGRADEFTSQLYFSDALTDRVHANSPYSTKKGQRLLNERDMIFREGGTKLLLPVEEQDGLLAATYRIAMRPGQPRQNRGRRGVRL